MAASPTAATGVHGSRRGAAWQTIAWLALLTLLISNVPLFVCLPLIDDAALWDLQVLNWLAGGVPYRDVFETNPPGMLWLQAAVRWTAGSSSIALRVADLLIIAALVLLFRTWWKRWGLTTGGQVGLTAVCFLFYFSMSEWCHCQRDVWMLLPAMVAVGLRRGQVERFLAGAEIWSARAVFARAVLEGLCWGLGVWIKPMIVVPALAAWLASAWQMRRFRAIAVDGAGLLIGGLLAGVLGAVFLWAAGAWPYFWETFWEWNPRYVAAGREHWKWMRLVAMVCRLCPWILAHVLAVPLAIAVLKSGSRGSSGTAVGGRNSGDASAVLFAAFYLGWVAQAFLLQHLFDYVQVPAMLLAIACCGRLAGPHGHRAGRWIAAGLLVIGLAMSSTIRPERLACWGRCLTEGSTPQVRDRLKLHPIPDWQDLERVADFLRDEGLKDGELCCFHNSVIHLYQRLGLRPPARFVFLETWIVFFPDRQDVLRRELEQSGPRYVVTDLVTAKVPREALDEIRPGHRLAASRVGDERVFPWSCPIVFRAGRYAVHRIDGRLGTLRIAPRE